jgi:glycine/D-amino acid oxidase-like deaminating enzyme
MWKRSGGTREPEQGSINVEDDNSMSSAAAEQGPNGRVLDHLLPELPAEADAVVIGAGAFGLATAYQLARTGAGKVVVLDQYEPGSQVSPKAAGLFKLIQTSEEMTRIAALSNQIVREFKAETGIAIPYEASGSLLVARTPQHGSMLDAEAEDSRGWGVELERIDQREAERRCPYLVGDGIQAVYHIPGDIYIEEPKSMLIAYRAAAEKLGAQVIGHTQVTGIALQGRGVSAIETGRGTIRTPVVVDAAGVWARLVGRLAKVDLRILPMRHQLRITAPLDEIDAGMPIVRIVDASGYTRPARDGLMYGGFEADPVPLETVPPSGFTIDMVPLDMTLPDQFRGSMKSTVPALTHATAQEERGGLFTMTPDGRLLAGPVASVEGLWVATGCNGSGFSLSSGIGKCLAEWIVNGESPVDLASLRPDRFGNEPIDHEEFRAACVWQYANYYTPH